MIIRVLQKAFDRNKNLLYNLLRYQQKRSTMTKVYCFGWEENYRSPHNDQGWLTLKAGRTMGEASENAQKITQDIRHEIHTCNRFACIPVLNLVAGIWKTSRGIQQCSYGNIGCGVALILSGLFDTLLWPIAPIVHIIAAQVIAKSGATLSA